MEPIDIACLEEAVVVFYRSTSQEQAITHEWLTKAQTSPQAWQFSWQLMQLGKVCICIHTRIYICLKFSDTSCILIIFFYLYFFMYYMNI